MRQGIGAVNQRRTACDLWEFLGNAIEKSIGTSSIFLSDECFKRETVDHGFSRFGNCSFLKWG
jgi:hypothetical protein